MLCTSFLPLSPTHLPPATCWRFLCVHLHPNTQCTHSILLYTGFKCSPGLPPHTPPPSPYSRELCLQHSAEWCILGYTCSHVCMLIFLGVHEQCYTTPDFPCEVDKGYAGGCIEVIWLYDYICMCVCVCVCVFVCVHLWLYDNMIICMFMYI